MFNMKTCDRLASRLALARHRLRRLTALTPSAHLSVGFASARSETERRVGARSAHCVPAGIPFLAPLDHDVENADQLAHACDQRHLLFFPLGNQAIVKGLQDWIVLCRRSKTGHIEHVAGPTPSALDVALASTSATVVIVRATPNKAATILLLGLAQLRHGGNQR